MSRRMRRLKEALRRWLYSDEQTTVEYWKASAQFWRSRAEFWRAELWKEMGINVVAYTDEEEDKN
jgi:hypothetical protein